MSQFFSVNVYISVHCLLYLSSPQSTIMCQPSTSHWGDPVSQWAGESCTEKDTINTEVRLARWRWLCFKESFSSVFRAYTRLESKCAKSRQVSLRCWLIIDLFFEGDKLFTPAFTPQSATIYPSTVIHRSHYISFSYACEFHSLPHLHTAHSV